MRSDEFLEMFRDLEEMLTLRYPADGRRHNSAVMEYINDPSNTKFREEMNTCREIRNLLTHHADVGGQAIVEPSEQMMLLLKQIIKYVEDPPVIVEAATPFQKLMTASPEQFAFGVMRKMRDRGFSHIPVLDHGKLIGIFSVSVPFSFAMENGTPISYSFRIGDFGEYLDPGNHCTERFIFASKSMTVQQASKEFEIVGSNKKRLAMILITDNGQQTGKIIGVVTPFDVIGMKEETNNTAAIK